MCFSHEFEARTLSDCSDWTAVDWTKIICCSNEMSTFWGGGGGHWKNNSKENGGQQTSLVLNLHAMFFLYSLILSFRSLIDAGYVADCIKVCECCGSGIQQCLERSIWGSWGLAFMCPSALSVFLFVFKFGQKYALPLEVYPQDIFIRTWSSFVFRLQCQ